MNDKTFSPSVKCDSAKIEKAKRIERNKTCHKSSENNFFLSDEETHRFWVESHS